MLCCHGLLLVKMISARTMSISWAATAVPNLFGEAAYWPTQTEMRYRFERAGFGTSGTAITAATGLAANARVT